MVLETLFFSPLNQLTRLVAREYFNIQCLRESYKSCNDNVSLELRAFSSRSQSEYIPPICISIA
jgi:hypothetical protein